MPERIQLRRTKGWRKPEGAIVVARPSKWGNPINLAEIARMEAATDRTLPPIDDRAARAFAVDSFRAWITTPDTAELLAQIAELAGHDLACWCPLDQPCHADVLLELANRPKPEDGET